MHTSKPSASTARVSHVRPRLPGDRSRGDDVVSSIIAVDPPIARQGLGASQIMPVETSERVEHRLPLDHGRQAPRLLVPSGPLGTLPVPVSSFVGRTRELATISRLLANGLLVTLTGPGGCGKTRLALEAARQISARFDSDVTFVSLAPLDHPGQVAGAVARALGIRESAGRSS